MKLTLSNELSKLIMSWRLENMETDNANLAEFSRQITEQLKGTKRREDGKCETDVKLLPTDLHTLFMWLSDERQDYLGISAAASKEFDRIRNMVVKEFKESKPERMPAEMHVKLSDRAANFIYRKYKSESPLVASIRERINGGNFLHVSRFEPYTYVIHKPMGLSAFTEIYKLAESILGEHDSVSKELKCLVDGRELERVEGKSIQIQTEVGKDFGGVQVDYDFRVREHDTLTIHATVTTDSDRFPLYASALKQEHGLGDMDLGNLRTLSGFPLTIPIPLNYPKSTAEQTEMAELDEALKSHELIFLEYPTSPIPVYIVESFKTVAVFYRKTPKRFPYNENKTGTIIAVKKEDYEANKRLKQTHKDLKHIGYSSFISKIESDVEILTPEDYASLYKRLNFDNLQFPEERGNTPSEAEKAGIRIDTVNEDVLYVLERELEEAIMDVVKTKAILFRKDLKRKQAEMRLQKEREKITDSLNQFKL